MSNTSSASELPLTGAPDRRWLAGHNQTETAPRYAHLALHEIRKSTEWVADRIAGQIL